MRRFSFVTVDVFTTQRFGGNPLAVFADARGLDDEEMQAIAREFNLSETTFVLPPADPRHSARVRIFTPAYEMPFAGHPNVGTGYVLATQGRDRDGRLTFEEIAGLVDVIVARDASGAVTDCTIAAPQPLALGSTLAAVDVAACAGLAASDVVTTAHAPQVASVGNPFAIVEVTGDALARATPDLAAFRAIEVHKPCGDKPFALYLYARDGAALRARMFAPLAGVIEDPATGSAATPLGALLLSLGKAQSLRVDIHQGVEMGRPSLLQVTATRGADGIRASVGGACVPVMRGDITL